MEPKLLPFPFDTDHLYEYNIRRPPALESTYAYALHAELDVGVPIDIIDPLSFEAPPEKAALHPLDQLITSPALAAASSKKASGACLPSEVLRRARVCAHMSVCVV